MLRILGTIFAALLGLCFGSFLNVCLSRWPAGESIVHPRSHCRACARTLTWWENLPLLSWIALRGRCRTCSTWISIRYPLVEAAVAVLWAVVASGPLPDVPGDSIPLPLLGYVFAVKVMTCGLLWLLVALASLDAENLWLPDFLTIPGIAIGILIAALDPFVLVRLDALTGLPLTEGLESARFGLWSPFLQRVADVLLAAAIILLIRFLYQLIRHREGIGLGDAKLMAMLAAWLGLPGALLSLFLGVVLGALYAVTMLLARSRRTQTAWATAQLPLGTFLCIGGIVSALWGRQIIEAYLRLFP
jgi:leader peptidase (prepilin peptidase) / N-methyltransferase